MEKHVCAYCSRQTNSVRMPCEYGTLTFCDYSCLTSYLLYKKD